MTSDQKIDAIILLLEKEISSTSRNLKVQTDLSDEGYRYYIGRREAASELLSQVNQILNR